MISNYKSIHKINEDWSASDIKLIQDYKKMYKNDKLKLIKLGIMDKIVRKIS